MYNMTFKEANPEIHMHQPGLGPFGMVLASLHTAVLGCICRLCIYPATLYE